MQYAVMTLISWALGAVLLLGLFGVWLAVDPAVRNHLPPELALRLAALGTEAAAAWVQAVFSVLAIYVAGRTVVLEHRNAALRDMESLEGCVFAIRQEVEAVSALLRAKGGRLGPLRDYSSERLTKLNEMLGAFPVQALGSNKAPLMIIELREILEELAGDVPLYANNGRNDAPNSHEIDLADRADAAVRGAHDEVRAWARGRRRHRDGWLLPKHDPVSP